MDDYAEINNFPPELSSGGDKYFHLRNYSEYSEYTSGFFLSLMIFIKSWLFSWKVSSYSYASKVLYFADSIQACLRLTWM